MSALVPHPSLFDAPMSQRDVDRGFRGRSRKTDPETSVAAANGISQSCEQAIKAVFALPRALADDELTELLPEWHPPTVVRARGRLHRDGFLVDSGIRKKSKRNRDQIVWCRAR